MKALLRFLVFVLFVSACVFGISLWKNRPATPAPSPADPQPVASTGNIDTSVLEALDWQFSKAVQDVLPSVVSIDASPKTSSSQDLLAMQMYGNGARGAVPPAKGSGVIVSDDGHVVTNLHVVRGADAIHVTFNDGRVFPATLEGSDKATDIAVLKIEADDIQPLKFGDSDTVRAGQIVFAVGNPFGLQESVSQGIISGLGRRVLNESLNEYIQTDSAVNPGNSGGPLINVRGQVVGINNFIFSQDGGSLGIGFAIPSNTVRKVVEDIVTHGRVIRPYLGAMFLSLNPALVRKLGLPDHKGALIQKVEKGSPADRAGLLPGDIVRSFRGRTIHDSIDFRNRVIETPADQTVEMVVLRDGVEKTLQVGIQEAALTADSFTLPVRPPSERGPLDGIVAAELNSRLASRWNVPSRLQGALVLDLQEGSPAARVLQPGDVIMEAGGQPVKTREDLVNAAENLPAGNPATIVIARNRYRFLVQLDPR